MWLYQRKMPWEKGERKPFVSMAIKVQPRIAPPPLPPLRRSPRRPSRRHSLRRLRQRLPRPPGAPDEGSSRCPPPCRE